MLTVLADHFTAMNSNATQASPNVLYTLAVFCERNEQTIYSHYTEGGGWEGWLQLEFVPWLRDRWTDTSARREIHVYANEDQKTDILMDKSPTFAYNTVIELKCESIYQDLTERHTNNEEKDSMTNFKRRVKKDIDKINAGLNRDYKPAHCWVFGITRGHNIAKNPGSIDWGTYAVDHTKVGNTDIVVWSWHKEVK